MPFPQHDEGLHVIDYGADRQVTRHVFYRSSCVSCDLSHRTIRLRYPVGERLDPKVGRMHDPEKRKTQAAELMSI